MSEIKEALGPQVTMTVFRKLKQLGYRSSFSHGGAYYTLHQIPAYDERGLWRCGPVGFSRHGTLLATCEALIQQAEAGCLASELKGLLGVEVKGALLQLVRQGRISRRKVAGRYAGCRMANHDPPKGLPKQAAKYPQWSHDSEFIPRRAVKSSEMILLQTSTHSSQIKTEGTGQKDRVRRQG